MTMPPSIGAPEYDADALTHTRFIEFRAEPSRDGYTLEGYAAVFNQPTEINDHLGSYTETIARGAFKKALSERTPVIQFDHGTHPIYGSLPIASVKAMREDAHGLYVKARMFKDPVFAALREAITEGAISGMSFRFQVTKEDWDDERSLRTIKEVRLHEFGPVVFPAYQGTSVALRSMLATLPAEERATVLGEFVVEPDAEERTTQPDVSEDDTPPVDAEPSEEVEPDASERTTRQDRRHMAAVLRGMPNAHAA